MSLIRVVDFETTGTEPTHEVCEWGTCDFDTDARRVFSPTWCLCRVAEIPPEARAVHHISASETQSEAPFDRDNFVGRALDDGVAAFAAHNAKFEAQWLGDCGGLHLICTYKVGLRLWPDAPEHNNGTLRYWLEDRGKINLDPALAQPAHRAGPDSYVTAHILRAAFEAGATGQQMVRWSREPACLPRCPIGQHRGKPWADVPTGFLEWMVHKAHDMDPDLKWNARQEIDRRFPL